MSFQGIFLCDINNIINEVMSSVFLRAFEQDDYLLINKWRNDPEIQKMTGGTFRYVSSEMEKEWVRDKMMHNITDVYCAICMNDETKKMIGYVSLNEINHARKCASAGGIVIGEKEYRDGIIVFEAFLMILDYAFSQLNIHRITGDCLVEHPFSPYLLRSFGFVLEGIKRDAIFKNGEYKDIQAYSLLQDEFFDMKNKNPHVIFSIVKKMRQLKKGGLK